MSNNANISNQQSIAYFELLLSMVALSVSFVMAKSLIQIMPVFIVLGLRFLIGTFIFLIISLMSSKAQESLKLSHISPRGWCFLFLQALFGAFLFNWLMLLGLRSANITNASVIISSIPAFISLFAYLFLQEVIPRTKKIAILMAVIGVALITVKLTGTMKFSISMGDVFVLLAVMSGALFPICTKLIKGDKTSPFLSSLAFNFFGALLLMPMFIHNIYIANNFSFNQLSTNVWALVILYSIAADVLYVLFWNFGLEKISASSASLFTAILPISTSILAYLCFGERLNLFQAAGMVLVIFSLLIGVKHVSFYKTKKTLSLLKPNN